MLWWQLLHDSHLNIFSHILNRFIVWAVFVFWAQLNAFERKPRRSTVTAPQEHESHHSHSIDCITSHGWRISLQVLLIQIKHRRDLNVDLSVWWCKLAASSCSPEQSEKPFIPPYSLTPCVKTQHTPPPTHPLYMIPNPSLNPFLHPSSDESIPWSKHPLSIQLYIPQTLNLSIPLSIHPHL